MQTRETPRATSFCGHTILQHEALVVRDATLDPRFHDNPSVVGEQGVRFYAGFPIRAPGGSNVGTLCIVDRKPRAFSDEDAVMLADLAAMVENELALLVQATQDPLTHLYNRRGLDEVAQHVIALCDRSQQSATLVSIDLDGFKGINDNHGHEAGDQVLRWFAGQLLKHFRKSDVVARLGGDEFCVLAPQVSEPEMRACLYRLAGRSVPRSCTPCIHACRGARPGGVQVRRRRRARTGAAAGRPPHVRGEGPQPRQPREQALTIESARRTPAASAPRSRMA